MGRIGNTEALQLDAIGLTTDEQGQLYVNSHYPTAIPHTLQYLFEKRALDVQAPPNMDVESSLPGQAP